MPTGISPAGILAFCCLYYRFIPWPASLAFVGFLHPIVRATPFRHLKTECVADLKLYTYKRGNKSLLMGMFDVPDLKLE